MGRRATCLLSHHPGDTFGWEGLQSQIFPSRLLSAWSSLSPNSDIFSLKNKYLRSLSSIKERKSSLEERKKHHQPILDPTFTEVLELLSELPCLTLASTVCYCLNLEVVEPCGPEGNLQVPSLPLTSHCVGHAGGSDVVVTAQLGRKVNGAGTTCARAGKRFRIKPSLGLGAVGQPHTAGTSFLPLSVPQTRSLPFTALL